MALAASASFRCSIAICRQAVHEAGCLQVRDRVSAVFMDQFVSQKQNVCRHHALGPVQQPVRFS